MPGVVAAAEALKEALSGFEPGVFSGADCARIAEVLTSTEKACAAARLLAARRAVGTGAHRERGFADGAAWLARHCGATPGNARRELDTASRLAKHPDTTEALLGGQISLDQAREITEVPDAESELLDLARKGDLTQVRDAIREHRQTRTDPAQLRRRQFSLREFRHWQDTEGMIRFAGALPPETGKPLVDCVEKLAQRLHADAKQAAKRGGPPLQRFDAYAADALHQLVTTSGGDGTSNVSVELVLVCDLAAWLRGHALEGEVCHILGGGPIPVETAKALAKDVFLKGVIHDGVNTVMVKHFGRHIPTALRTALDLGPPPRFAGRKCTRCGATFGLQRDHDDPLANGGATQMSNLKDLCYPCHLEKTEEDRQAGLLGPNPPTPEQAQAQRNKRRPTRPPPDTS